MDDPAVIAGIVAEAVPEGGLDSGRGNARV